MSQRTIAPNLKALTAEARQLVDDLESMGRELEQRLTSALDRAWQLGRKLLTIKALVGHGNWLVWLESNLRLCARAAQRHMELAASNPNAETIEDLCPESVRKFRLRYVPEKERPKLDGDQALPRVCHHLTLVNDWRRWQRRVEIGQVKVDQEEVRRDLEPLFRWLCGVYGVTPENS